MHHSSQSRFNRRRMLASKISGSFVYSKSSPFTRTALFFGNGAIWREVCIRALKLIFLISAVFLFSSETFAFEKTELWKNTISDRYSKQLEELSQNWSSIKFLNPDKFMTVQPIPTAEDATYVGILSQINIDAPLKEVRAVLADISNYVHIYQGLDKVETKATTKDDSVIYWVFSGPLGTKTKYTTVQHLGSLTPQKGFLFYQLKESPDVTVADGAMFLEEKEGKTKFMSIDFFNAHWGTIGSLFKTEIWRETCYSTAKFAFALKKMSELKALKGEELFKKIAAKSENGYDPKLVSSYCEKMRDRKNYKAFERLVDEIVDGDKGVPSSNPIELQKSGPTRKKN